MRLKSLICNHSAWRIWALLWIILSRGASLTALEVHLNTGLMFFDPKVEKGTEIHIADSGGEYNFIGNLRVIQYYNDTISLDFLMEHDPILLNRTALRLGFHSSFFSIQAGPFIGLFNGPLLLNPGISLTAQGRISTLIFGSFHFDTTLNTGINQPGDFSQNRTAFQVGFHTPFHIAADFGMQIKTHTVKQENSAVITTNRIQYRLAGTYTEKPWYFSQIRAALGYQELTWSLSSGYWNREYKHQSLYAGIELGFQIRPFLNLTITGEIPLYSWVAQNIQTQEIQNTLLCEFTLGVSWKLKPGPAP